MGGCLLWIKHRLGKEHLQVQDLRGFQILRFLREFNPLVILCTMDLWRPRWKSWSTAPREIFTAFKPCDLASLASRGGKTSRSTWSFASAKSPTAGHSRSHHPLRTRSVPATGKAWKGWGKWSLSSYGNHKAEIALRRTFIGLIMNRYKTKPKV